MRGCRAGCPAMVVGLLLVVGCSRQSAVPVAASSGPPSDEQHLPFAQTARATGISPTSAVIPPGAHIPAGTPVTVHLRSRLSSATARTGDAFEAVLDEPIVVNGQVLAEQGAPVTGRIMEAKTAGVLASPGYLRLTLGSITIRGQALPAQSSSTFAKGGGPPRKRNLAFSENESGRALAGAAVPTSGVYPIGDTVSVGGKSRGPVRVNQDVTVGSERRLTFRLTEPIPLHE
jgi:hypothetical protein